MRALALNTAAINTQFCGNFIRVYRGTRGPNSKQSWILTMTSIVIRDRCCFTTFTHRGNRAEMKNGHGGSSGRPGYEALTFLLRFNLVPWYDSIEWIFIIYVEQKEEKHCAQGRITYHGIENKIQVSPSIQEETSKIEDREKRVIKSWSWTERKKFLFRTFQSLEMEPRNEEKVYPRKIVHLNAIKWGYKFQRSRDKWLGLFINFRWRKEAGMVSKN